MTWILLAAAAQFLNAIVALIDKYIVSDKTLLPKPFVYAFYTCLLSGAWIFVYAIGFVPVPFIGAHLPDPTGVLRPTLEVVALAFLGAYTFFIALVSMFNAFKLADASDVVPVVGAVSALGSFGLGYFFLHTTLSPNFMLGVGLLATGTFLVSRLQFTPKVSMYSFHAGLFFALHYVVIKGLFTVTSFDDGFFWSRLAFLFFALSLLLVPDYYAKIKKQTQSADARTGVLVFTNKVLAGVVTILILRATDMGDVAVVQALGGLQFVFILVLGIMFGPKTPKSFGENNNRKEGVIQKAVFVAIITFGFLVLFI